MKIAILSFYSGHIERGVENWTHELATRLYKSHEVVVLQNGPKKREKYEIVSTDIGVNWEKRSVSFSPIRLIYLDYYSRIVGYFTLKVLKILIRENFDIIIPTNGGWQVAIVRLYSWLARKKMVVVGHSGPAWDDMNNLFAFPNVFIALSERAKKWAKKRNPLVKVVVIPDGVNVEKFTPKGVAKDIKLERPIILLVGAAQLGKRLDLAIKAVSKIKKGSLIILGKGPRGKSIGEFGKNTLKDRFLMKAVPHEQIPNYYRSCDLFTLPSWGYEAFGMVYLEAMACNKPVVATDDELRREIIGDAGILVDPTDIELYAKALEKATKTDWGDKPRKQAEKFSWDKVVKRYEDLFDELLKS